MVEVATSLGRTGLQDWLIQRVSAVIIAIYTIFLISYFLLHAEIAFPEWQQLFASNSMRYASLLVLISLLAHAWIGFWTISTDYVKILSIRLAIQILFMIAMFFCLVWGIQILWR